MLFCESDLTRHALAVLDGQPLCGEFCFPVAFLWKCIAFLNSAIAHAPLTFVRNETALGPDDHIMLRGSVRLSSELTGGCQVWLFSFSAALPQGHAKLFTICESDELTMLVPRLSLRTTPYWPAIEWHCTRRRWLMLYLAHVCNCSAPLLEAVDVACGW